MHAPSRQTLSHVLKRLTRSRQCTLLALCCVVLHFFQAATAAQSAVHSAQLGQAPAILLQCNEAGGLVVADSSGNALEFASTAGCVSAPSLLFAPKNSSAGAITLAPGRAIKRTVPADTNSRFASTGVEVEFFFSSSDASSRACPLDTRRANASDGLAILCNYSSALGAASPAWLSIVATDNATPPRSSYLDVHDGVAPFWRDALKHRLVVRYRMAESAAAANEVFEAELDGVVLVPASAARNQAGSAAGTFTDHAEFICIGSGPAGTHSWTATIQQFAWFSRIRAAAESKAVWGAACYDIGDGIGCGLNGVIHYDMSVPVYAAADFTGAATVGSNAAALPNCYDIARGGDGTSGGATNVAGGLTRPKLVQDARGYRALYFDNFNQNTSPQKQSLAIGSLGSGSFGLAQTSMTAVVAARAGSNFAVSTGNIMRLTGSGNQLRLIVRSDRPRVELNNVDVGTSSVSVPLVPCVPGPGVVGLSTRFVNGVPQGWVTCNGVVGALSRDLAMGAYWNPLTSGGTIGCCDDGYNGFDGLFYEGLIESCPHDEADQAARNAWLSHKWGIDRQDLRLIVGCTSIENGTPASSEAAISPGSTFGWAGFLSSPLQKRLSCFNAAIGGSQSGRLFTTDGTNTPYVDNGNFPATERGYGSPVMYMSSGGTTTPGGTIVVLEPFTNSVAKSVIQRGGEDVSAQCIAHIETLLAQVHSAAPGVPIILLMYPTNASFGYCTSATGVALTAWAAQHAGDFAAVITPNALPSGQWIHPTGGLPGSNSNDYLYLAGLIEAAIRPLVPAQPGVCCSPTGACQAVAATGFDDSVCAGLGTLVSGATCSPSPCIGICCTPLGVCSLSLQGDCAGPNTWTGGATCAAAPCPLPPPTGTCCTPAGVCSITTQADCPGISAWTVDATCEVSPCPLPPFGTCCTPAGVCSITAQADCSGPNTWTADATCEASPCPLPPVGACCNLSTGTCSLVVQADCQVATWVANTPCAATQCETGACCTGTSCSITANVGCSGAATFLGLGTVCGTPTNPLACCTANFNGINGLTVRDVFDYLDAWFGGDLRADTNADGHLAVADVFTFLDLWFAGCG